MLALGTEYISVLRPRIAMTPLALSQGRIQTSLLPVHGYSGWGGLGWCLPHWRIDQSYRLGSSQPVAGSWSEPGMVQQKGAVTRFTFLPTK